MLSDKIKKTETWFFLFLFLTFIFIPLLLLTISGAETYADAVRWKLFFFLLIFFILASAFCLLFLILRKTRPEFYQAFVNIFQKILLLAISALAALLILEVIVRILIPDPEPPLDLRGLHRKSPLPGVLYELQPGATKTVTRGNSGTIEYSVNELGFRAGEFSLRKPEDTFRILTIGDSVSFGIDLKTQERYTEKLEDKLHTRFSGNDFPRFQVINMSVGGWNTYNELSWLRRRGMELEPDLILWQFHMNDVDDPIGHLGTNTFCLLDDIPLDYFPDPEDPDITNNIFTKTPEQISFFEVLSWYGNKYSRVFRALYGIVLRIFPPPPDPHAGKPELSWCLEYLADKDSIQWKWLRKNFRKIKTLKEDNDVPVVFLLAPLAYQLNSDNPVYSQSIENVEEHLSKIGFPVVNIKPALERESGDENFRFYLPGDASHFNAGGHTLIAEEMLNKTEPLIRKQIRKSTAP